MNTQEYQKRHYISVLGVTNIVNRFKVTQASTNGLKIKSTEELALNSIIQVKDEKIKEFNNNNDTALFIVDQCHIEDEILITCKFIDH